MANAAELFGLYLANSIREGCDFEPDGETGVLVRWAISLPKRPHRTNRAILIHFDPVLISDFEEANDSAQNVMGANLSRWASRKLANYDPEENSTGYFEIYLGVEDAAP